MTMTVREAVYKDIAIKPLRPIGKGVFRIIVEMAYEMEKADKINIEKAIFEERAKGAIGLLNDTRKKRNLRSLTPTPTDHIMDLPVFQCNGRDYRVCAYIRYTRIRGDDNKIKEVGNFYVFITKDVRGIILPASKLTDSYDTDEKFHTVKKELTEIFINNAKYMMWS